MKHALVVLVGLLLFPSVSAGQQILYSFEGVIETPDDLAGEAFRAEFVFDAGAATTFGVGEGVRNWTVPVLSASFTLPDYQFQVDGAQLQDALVAVWDGIPPSGNSEGGDLFSGGIGFLDSPDDLFLFFISSSQMNSALTTSSFLPTSLDLSLAERASATLWRDGAVFRGMILTAATVQLIPGPGVASVLAVGGLFAGRRRR